MKLGLNQDTFVYYRRLYMSYKLELEKMFCYHPPKGDQVGRYVTVRSAGRDLAEYIMKQCPDSPEKTLAIRKVQEAVMWANASIAINEAD